MRTKVYHLEEKESKEYSFLNYWVPNLGNTSSLTAFYDIEELSIKKNDSLLLDENLEWQNGDLVFVRAIESDKVVGNFIARITEEDGRVLYQTDLEWSLGAVRYPGTMK